VPARFTASCATRIYTGEFEWKGHLHKGRHQPIITRELWERVQGVLDGGTAKDARLQEGVRLRRPQFLMMER
jgi:recombinase